MISSTRSFKVPIERPRTGSNAVDSGRPADRPDRFGPRSVGWVLVLRCWKRWPRERPTGRPDRIGPRSVGSGALTFLLVAEGGSGFDRPARRTPGRTPAYVRLDGARSLWAVYRKRPGRQLQIPAQILKSLRNTPARRTRRWSRPIEAASGSGPGTLRKGY